MRNQLKQENLERRQQAEIIKTAIREHNAQSVKETRKVSKHSPSKKEKSMLGSEHEVSNTRDQSSNQLGPPPIVVRSKYLAKLNSNRQAVEDNKLKLKSLQELE